MLHGKLLCWILLLEFFLANHRSIGDNNNDYDYDDDDIDDGDQTAFIS